MEVTNCFCVPHKEYEERVEFDIQYAQDMFELNKKVAPQVIKSLTQSHFKLHAILNTSILDIRV